MKTFALSACFFVTFSSVTLAQDSSQRFQKILLSEEFHSEGAAVADINNDGNRDIVSGPYWYEGPEFRVKHAYAPVKSYSIKGYSDHFFSFTDDLNEDGLTDIISIPIPGGDAVWYEHPKSLEQPWKRHVLAHGVGNESPDYRDVDGDGKKDLVFIQSERYGFASRVAGDPDATWTFRPISDPRGYGRFTHGMGIGDVDGDGRLDLLEKDGWWQQPASKQGRFQFHRSPLAEAGGSQMFVRDFDGDGDGDIVSVQNAHAYGLCWFERRGDSPNEIQFVKHTILGNRPDQNPYGLAISQMHALAVADIDGDGIDDLITGKRYWAHGGGDPGAQELPVLYWFKTVRTADGVTFVPMLIDERVGIGTQLTIDDVDQNGLPDIIVGNKLGTVLLLNHPVVDVPPKRSTAPRHTVGTGEFQLGIRTTDPLTPEEERATFVLPAGFEAQLVASEPDIAKPMNLAFDQRGRLWVSSSSEYPYPAPADREGRDTIKILEDTDGDGRADKVTTFADKLNVPIGLYPYGDGVICFSIPNIWYLRDTDGDDVADRREVLYGPFDTTRDTHGMCNAFRRGYDGWLYACHGFNNQSSVSGEDGNTVTMHSGNTFRMRLDGSRIEHFTHGQVNPFGMAFDPFGNAFTADCHTKPITLLMRGGYYPSFGKPHDGLGFVPQVMEHLHGSTAIGGIAVYHGGQFPPVFNDNAFGGNVMTSRINRNSIQRVGASIQAREESDFLISGDPWFRPVDLAVGPDGALYVADFYNRIIGHYEVPLNHPGRDRHSGRIWRIVYTGSDQRRDVPAESMTASAWTTPQTAHQAVKLLESDNLIARMLASDVLADQFSMEATEAIRTRLETSDNANLRVHALRTLGRIGTLQPEDIESALADSDARLRSHAIQAIRSIRPVPTETTEWIGRGLSDADPVVVRTAALASSVAPDSDLIEPLFAALHRAGTGDVHLVHALRMALRDHLKDPIRFEKTVANVDAATKRQILSLCLAIRTDRAGAFVANNVATVGDLNREELSEYLTFSSRYADAENLDAVAAMVQDRFAGDIAFQEQMLQSIRAGLLQRGSEIPAVVRDWAETLARQLLGLRPGQNRLSAFTVPIGWTNVPHASNRNKPNPWVLSTRRQSADGQQNSPLFSSFPNGETLTGTYRSNVFELPQIFSFFLAGHDGYPDKPIQHKNVVRVRDAATHAVLQKWSPPRNDTAQKMEWDTGNLAGKQAYLELVDDDTATAFAWLAVGRFSVAGLNPSGELAKRRRAATIIGDFGILSLVSVLEQMISDPSISRSDAREFAIASLKLNPIPQGIAVAETLSVAGIDAATRRDLTDWLLSSGKGELAPKWVNVMKVATGEEQYRIAERLSTNVGGMEQLVSLIESGHASPRLLLQPTIKERINSIASADLARRAESITRDLPDEDAEMQKQLVTSKQSYLSHAGNVAAGQQIFKTQCGICHKVAGVGAEVGPNLDGIGNRGLDRVLEDVLLPSRNVDAAFRATVLLTDEGRVINGLVKRTEGTQLVIVDQKGKEISVPVDSIEQQKQVKISPMPANFHEVLDEPKRNDLLAYLLSLTH